MHGWLFADTFSIITILRVTFDYKIFKLTTNEVLLFLNCIIKLHTLNQFKHVNAIDITVIA